MVWIWLLTLEGIQAIPRLYSMERFVFSLYHYLKLKRWEITERSFETDHWHLHVRKCTLGRSKAMYLCKRGGRVLKSWAKTFRQALLFLKIFVSLSDLLKYVPAMLIWKFILQTNIDCMSLLPVVLYQDCVFCLARTGWLEGRRTQQLDHFALLRLKLKNVMSSIVFWVLREPMQ